jgi:hypothetical protein
MRKQSEWGTVTKGALSCSLNKLKQIKIKRPIRGKQCRTHLSMNFGVRKWASRIRYHEWQRWQSIGVIYWNKHWSFGVALIDPSFGSRQRNIRSFRNTTMDPLMNERTSFLKYFPCCSASIDVCGWLPTARTNLGREFSWINQAIGTVKDLLCVSTVKRVAFDYWT